MRIRTIHQLARFEREAQPYIKRMQRYKRQHELRLGEVVRHAAVLAFLVRYGKPRIEEPLSRACERCEGSDAWKECCERFPIATGSRGSFRPYDTSKYYQFRMAEAVRHAVDWFFPGTDERNKLNRVFKSAPPWFVWFTFADYSARKLGLTIPNLSSVARFERAHESVDLGDWFSVPEGKFERRLWENGVEKRPFVCSNIVKAHEDQATPRELRRANRFMGDRRQEDIWPALMPLEFIELTVQDMEECVQSGSTVDALYTIMKRKYPNIRFV